MSRLTTFASTLRTPAVAPRYLALVGALAVAAAAVACQGEHAAPASDQTATDAVTTAAPDASSDRARGFSLRREAAARVAAAPPAVAEQSLSAAGVVGGAAAGDATGNGSAFSTGQIGHRFGDDDSAPDMVIRSGTASVQVDSIDVAVQRVRQLAQRVGGVIANSSLQGGRDQVRTATLEVKVAAPRFEELVTGLTPFGKVESVNVTAEEVGEEYVDISARVANARRLEARLIDLLATRTGKLSDVLTVERELARVREEIERYEGRLRYLKSRAAVSTLAITVHEPPPLLAGAPSTNPIAEALRQAWRNFVGLSAAVIASLGVLVPLAGIAALAWIGVRRFRKEVVTRAA
ncbi:MAG TPA: DUF4349 domain-containing protein [Gemmatimonadaceae bacterium]|nr:DUF4349 domain-containing protein [Gemmatimonadaceae bacterium]